MHSFGIASGWNYWQDWTQCEVECREGQFRSITKGMGIQIPIPLSLTQLVNHYKYKPF